MWVCPNRPTCHYQRNCARAVREAFAEQGPVFPCVICLAECDLDTAFRWPCNHVYHNDCVPRLYARTPRPPCPTCRTPWSDDTERRFRNTCTPRAVPDLSMPTGSLIGSHRRAQTAASERGRALSRRRRCVGRPARSTSGPCTSNGSPNGHVNVATAPLLHRPRPAQIPALATLASAIRSSHRTQRGGLAVQVRLSSMRSLRVVVVFSWLYAFSTDQYHRAALFVALHPTNLRCG